MKFIIILLSYAKQVRVLSAQMPNKRKQLLPGLITPIHFYTHTIHIRWYILCSVRLFIFILINVIEMSESYDAHSTHTHHGIR